MEGFKPFKKIQCFKEGGSVKYESRKMHKEEESADIAQDKKVIKKAFKMHDEQEHKGESTNLSKLKKGGRAKKDCGTVRKYKTGGSVDNEYSAKKTDKDLKDIANTKRQKPVMLCGGKSVNKYSGEFGSHVTPTEQAHAKDRYREKMRLDPTQQRQLEAQQAAAAMANANQLPRPVPMPSAPQGPQTAPMPQPSVAPQGALSGLTPMKKGGKAKKACK